MKYLKFAAVLAIFIGSATAAHQEINTTGEPVLGQEDAEVTLILYEDFECPFCKRFEQNTFPQIKENYIETGRVKAVWKDFPLTQLHPWSDDAAKTMECVYRKGGNDAFWSVKNKVFANQDSLSQENVESQIKSWASEGGVSESELEACLENGDPMEEVNADRQEGENFDVSGTPTVFVGHKKIVGAQPYSNFENEIEAALNGNQDAGNSQPENPENNENNSETDAGDLEDRLENETGGSDTNITALKEKVNQQQEKINELEKEQNAIVDVLNKILGLLGI